MLPAIYAWLAKAALWNHTSIGLLHRSAQSPKKIAYQGPLYRWRIFPPTEVATVNVLEPHLAHSKYQFAGQMKIIVA
jgi:hypothetical protein